MILNQKTNNKIVNNLNRKLSKPIKEVILKNAKEYGIDENVIISIFSIEIYYRNIFFRMCEIILLIKSVILNLLFGVKIKNYTIGKMQIGLTTILLYNKSYNSKFHDRYINYRLKFKDIFCLFKALEVKNNISIACWKINYYNNKLKEKWGDINTNVGRIGQYYNGQFNYGYLLRGIYEIISKRDVA